MEAGVNHRIELERPENFLIYRLGSGDTVEILDIAVHPDDRRKGIGRRMVQELKRRLDQESLLLWAVTRVGNVAACQFYEALGFRIVGRLHHFYRTREEMTLSNSGYNNALMFGLDI